MNGWLGRSLALRVACLYDLQVHQYTVNLEVGVLNENDLLKGEPILLGFEVRVGELFVE